MLRGISAFVVFLFSVFAHSADRITLHEINQLNDELLKLDQMHQSGIPYVLRVPYVPPMWDYGLEVGYFSTLQNNYWTGFNVGRHVGTCVFVDTQTCQQYVDLLMGLGGRESRTHVMLAPSVRWQWVNFPTYWSAMARVFGGATSSVEPEGVNRRALYGIGLGVTTYLHPRADLRLEARFGQSDYPFAQIFISFQFKMDKWVEYFADRLKALGIGAVQTTGSVLKGTVETTGKVIEKTAETTGSVIGTTVKTTGTMLKTTADVAGEAAGMKKKATPKPVAGPTASPTPSPTPTPSPPPKK
ncbi:MAG: hypothetical protein ABL958_03165 [Bdellovibrionia bacterium]